MTNIPTTPRPSNDTTFQLATLGVCAVVLVASCVLRIEGATRVMIPGTHIALPGVCWFRRVLNIDCPGCGLTRSFISLAHGRIMDAFYFNPAGPLLFALVVSQIPYQSCQWWRARRGLSRWKFGAYATVPIVVFAGALFAQWLIRLCAPLFG